MLAITNTAKNIAFVIHNFKNSRIPPTYPRNLHQLGEINIDLVNSYKQPSFITFDAMFALNILPLDKIDKFLAKAYKKSYIEIVQVSYLRSKLKPLEKESIEKLISVNPYTRGLKKMMLAFIEEEQKNANQLYIEAIENLEHIKYYCVEAQYFYSKFLYENGSDDFLTIYQAGLALTKKHHYRYLQYLFEGLLNPKIDNYDSKNYPLPNNEDFSDYVQGLIKDNKKNR